MPFFICEIFGLGFFLCFTYSLVCLSRGHWLALAIALVALLGCVRRCAGVSGWLAGARFNLRLSAGLAVLAAVVFLLPSFYSGQPEGEAGLLGSVASPESSALRLGFYRNTLAMIADHPLTGIGPGAFYTGIQSYFGAPVPLTSVTELTGIAHAHNSYLQYLAELGIPAGLLMWVLLGMFWRRSWVVAGRAARRELPLQDMAFLAGTTAVLVHAMVDFPLSHPVTSVFIWTWVGAVSHPGRAVAATSGTVNDPNRRIRALLGLLVVAYLSLVGVQGYRTLAAYRLAGEAAHFVSGEQCDKALPAADAAFSLAPEHYLVWQYSVLTSSFCDKALRGRYLAAERVLERDPNHPYALLVKANALYQAGQLEPAASLYQRLIELLPLRMSGYLGLANVRRLQGQTGLADEYYARARKIRTRLGRAAYPGPAGRTLAALAIQATGEAAPLPPSECSTRGEQMNRNSGFTLIELIVTVGILAILAAIAIPAYNGYIATARQGAAESNLDPLRLAEEDY